MEEHLYDFTKDEQEEGEEEDGTDVLGYPEQNGNTKLPVIHIKATNGATPPADSEEEETRRKCCNSSPFRIGFKKWFLKYFWEGQVVSGGAQTVNDLPPGAGRWERFMVRYRRPLGMLIPAAFFNFWWWAYAIRYNLWHLFASKYFICITMLFGSMIAGMTSVGGGAVAFPVLTLAFNVAPYNARDFSLMIQACGMSAAAFTIFFMRVQLDWASLICCTIGGIPGIIVGFEVLDPRLTPPQKKMGFVSIWFSFAFSLFLLNRYSKRKTYLCIPNLKVWKVVVLLLTGFFGGLCSSFAGSGLDMTAFSVLTLLFRVSEKTATPTSVVLMAGNTVIGFYWRHIMMPGGIAQIPFEFFFVCIPIVVLGAPLGSLLGTHFHRQVLAALVYILDSIALISAFVLVKQTPILTGVSAAIIIGGFIFFFVLTKIGNRLLDNVKKENSLKEKEMLAAEVISQTKV